MSTLTDTKDSTKMWNTEVTPNMSTQTVDITTAGTYLDRDIEVVINPIPISYESASQSLVIGTTTTGVSSNTLTLN